MSTPYIKGFNEGYVLAEHLPKLAKSIANVASASVYLEGFRDGCEEYVREHAIQGFLSWLRKDHGGMYAPDGAATPDSNRQRDRRDAGDE